MCGSMVGIQSPTAEIRRGNKKEERKKRPQDENIMTASATQGGHNNHSFSVTEFGLHSCGANSYWPLLRIEMWDREHNSLSSQQVNIGDTWCSRDDRRFESAESTVDVPPVTFKKRRHCPPTFGPRFYGVTQIMQYLKFIRFIITTNSKSIL